MTRRTVLTAAGATAAATGLATLATACGSDDRSAAVTAQRLAPLVSSAVADSVAATTLITQVPDRAAALRVIASERRTHARLLEDEIGRLYPQSYSPSPVDGGIAGRPSAASGSPPITVGTLRSQLNQSARQAAELAIEENGYLAGLLGSINAAVECHIKVQLQ